MTFRTPEQRRVGLEAVRENRWGAALLLLFGGCAGVVLVAVVSAIVDDVLLAVAAWALLLAVFAVRWWLNGHRDEAVVLVLGGPALAIVATLFYFVWAL